MARVFGEILGIKEGTVFSSRDELRLAGVHCQQDAGISGSQNEGSESIVLSGGYEDDQDFGNEIIYTGSGGRDSSGRQFKDQEFTRFNKGLGVSCDVGLPVRVIRGYKHKSPYSPKTGYRYDGLYFVEEYWSEIGKSGYLIWRYRLRRLGDDLQPSGKDKIVSRRTQQIVQRIVRNTQIATQVKENYKFKCQVCGERIKTLSGFYAEAAHIQPLGGSHNGPDLKENVLCLCPNHHVMFDKGGFTINDDFSLNGIGGNLTVLPKHKIGSEFLRYHREHWKLVEAEK